MPEDEKKETINLDNLTVTSFKDFLKHLDEADVTSIFSSKNVDPKSVYSSIFTQKLVKEDSEVLKCQHTVDRQTAEAKFKELSESSIKRYIVLLNHFKEWKEFRQNLLKFLESSSSILEKTSTIVSCFRIFTSAVDICGTMFRNKGSLAIWLMENASKAGIWALFFERVISFMMDPILKNVIQKDQESFEALAQWFQLTDDALDSAVKKFFPYGIDKEELMKIHSSSENLEDCQKLFIAACNSNLKYDADLFKNKEFLGTVDCFATSEVGILWLNKVLNEKDYCFVHISNLALSEEIQRLMEEMPNETLEVCKDAMNVVPKFVSKASSTATMKIVLNFLSVLPVACNLWFGIKPEKYHVFNKLQKRFKDGLQNMQTIVLLLNPSESEIDPMLIN